MSNGKRVMLIIATILVVGGSVISFGAFAAADFKFENLSTESRNWTPTTKTFDAETEAAHSSIVVRGLVDEVRFEPTDGDAVEVTYWTNENKSFNVADNNGAITIEGSSEPHIGIMMIGSFEDHTTVVKVPRSYAGSLDISLTSGNVDVSKLSGLGTVTAKTSSGNVELTHLSADDIALETASGNAYGSDIQASQVSVNGTSGDIELSNVTTSETVKVNTTSGSQRLSKVSTITLEAHVGSGDIDASSIDAADTMYEVTSGSVRSSFVGADDEYAIEASSVSGDVRAPAGSATASKHVIARTMSGDVILSFANGDSSVTNGSDAPKAPEAPEAPVR